MSAPRSLKKLKEKKLACIFVTIVTIMQRGFCKSCLLVPGFLAHPRICRLSLHTGACTEPTMGQGSERMRSPAPGGGSVGSPSWCRTRTSAGCQQYYKTSPQGRITESKDAFSSDFLGRAGLHLIQSGPDGWSAASGELGWTCPTPQSPKPGCHSPPESTLPIATHGCSSGVV